MYFIFMCPCILKRRKPIQGLHSLDKQTNKKKNMSMYWNQTLMKIFNYMHFPQILAALTNKFRQTRKCRVLVMPSEKLFAFYWDALLKRMGMRNEQSENDTDNTLPPVSATSYFSQHSQLKITLSFWHPKSLCHKGLNAYCLCH